MSEIWDKYHPSLSVLAIVLALVALSVFVLPYDPEALATGIDYGIPSGTSLYGLLPMFGILSLFLFLVLWVHWDGRYY